MAVGIWSASRERGGTGRYPGNLSFGRAHFVECPGGGRIKSPVGRGARAVSSGWRSRPMSGKSARPVATRICGRSSSATSTCARPATTIVAFAPRSTPGLLLDEGSAKEVEADLRSTDPLGFPEYTARLKKAASTRRRSRCPARRSPARSATCRSAWASWTSPSWAGRWDRSSAKRSRGWAHGPSSASIRSSSSQRPAAPACRRACSRSCRWPRHRRSCRSSRSAGFPMSRS